MNPRYPIYVISKGRWESRQTARALLAMSVPFRIVIEPQELEKYAAVLPREIILVTPFSNLGQGSIPVRNFVWEHAIAAGAARHWVIDDNIRKFYRFHRNLKIPVADGTILRAAEDFTDRYENVGLSGLQYYMFAPRKKVIAPLILNTRIYSCILVNNRLPFRWRGRYNEDTDLSLRALKAGWCTILFNAFLCHKAATMTMKGGNTDELYQGDGRLKMARSLQAQHPDVVVIKRRWDRWQHVVDYSRFKHNFLIRKKNQPAKTGVDNYGMDLVRIEKVKRAGS